LPARLAVRLAPDEHRASVWLPWQQAVQRCFSPTNRRAIELLPQRIGARSSG
jgi:dATP pyrophosphohydrolase